MTNAKKFRYYAPSKDVGIYSIECLVNGKKYIGSSTQLSRRKVILFSNLRNGKQPNRQLQEDFDRFGEDSFVFNVLLTSYSTKQTLSEWSEVDLEGFEEYFIRELNTRNNKDGYNKHISQRPSKVTYHRQSRSGSGKSNGMYGKHHSAKTTQKMSKIRKEKGYAKGTNNVKAKLDKETYDRIVEMIFEDTGESYEKKYRRLAEKFNISAITLKRIKLGKHHFARRGC